LSVLHLVNTILHRYTKRVKTKQKNVKLVAASMNMIGAKATEETDVIVV